MPRGYWLSIIALGGLLIAAAPSVRGGEQPRATKGKTERQAPVSHLEPAHAAGSSQVLQNQGKALEERELDTYDPAKPCENFKSAIGSDLCQQWRMAEAAERQADLIELNNRLLLGEMAALFLTLAFSIYTATSAFIASKGQLRAYVQVKLKQIETSRNGRKYFVGFINRGETPARKIRYGSTAKVFPTDQGSISFSSVILHKADQSIFPRTDAPMGQDLFVPMNKEEQTEIIENRKQLFIWGRLEYEDIFGHTRATTFRFKLKGEGFEEGNPIISLDGNDAT